VFVGFSLSLLLVCVVFTVGRFKRSLCLAVQFHCSCFALCNNVILAREAVND